MEKEDQCNKILAQIKEVKYNTDRIDETLATYQGHKQFLEDIHEFRALQKYRNSQRNNRTHSKPLVLDKRKQNNLFKAVSEKLLLKKSRKKPNMKEISETFITAQKERKGSHKHSEEDSKDSEK